MFHVEHPEVIKIIRSLNVCGALAFGIALCTIDKINQSQVLIGRIGGGRGTVGDHYKDIVRYKEVLAR